LPVWIRLILSLCKTAYANKGVFCIIYKHVNVVYGKTGHEDTIFVSENL